MSVEKEYFLATATIEKSEYMVDEAVRFADTRLVLAETDSDARAKYMAYWKRKSVPYGIEYVVYNLEVTDAIR
jgi:hypothetical protein